MKKPAAKRKTAEETVTTPDAKAEVAKKKPARMVDAKDWKSRHAELLSVLPKEAHPEDLPHGEHSYISG